MDWNDLLLAAAYLTLLGLVWGTLWLILANGRFDGRSPVRRLLDRARALLAPWPLLWLVAYAALIARAGHAAGEWPRLFPFSFSEGWTANVHASEFPLHVMWLDALGLAALASILFFLPLHTTNPLRSARSRALLTLFAVPFAVLLSIACTEGPGNALNWLSHTR